MHYKVQALQQAARSRGTSETAWGTWEEGRDLVVSESRGSTTIERYVDPSDPALPDFTDPAHADATLDPYYRFRVIGTKRFTP
ncbi:hypothetical protein [Verrucomicrobium spinosum]|uniref:hypothetical protein n=1 Tax=Verrucomicrobium spinosum TaxID=2736 RepID=UPI000492CA29|nr:hypothetical protein [Verrucomicrobium spinosum]